MENPSTQHLLRRLIIFGGISQLALVLLLLVPGGIDYWQGWSFVAVHIAASLTFMIYFYRHDRELLARRLLRRETVRTQKIIMLLVKQVAVLFYVFCGLDHHYGWSREWLVPVPWWVSVQALGGYAGCFLLFIPVLNANRFAASVIQVESGQVLAEQGAYRLVRHPFYSVSLLLWCCLPPALGSWLALPAILLILPLLAWRLLDEEKLLRRKLPGYAEYCQRTPWRLIPAVW